MVNRSAYLMFLELEGLRNQGPAWLFFKNSLISCSFRGSRCLKCKVSSVSAFSRRPKSCCVCDIRFSMPCASHLDPFRAILKPFKSLFLIVLKGFEGLDLQIFLRQAQAIEDLPLSAKRSHRQAKLLSEALTPRHPAVPGPLIARRSPAPKGP